jgi:hypothetical protein
MFSCGNDDLDEFFNKDAHYYSAQLLGKSYCFRLKDNLNIIICAFSVSKFSANREKNKMNEFIFYCEVPPKFCYS